MWSNELSFTSASSIEIDKSIFVRYGASYKIPGLILIIMTIIIIILLLLLLLLLLLIFKKKKKLYLFHIINKNTHIKKRN